MQNAELELECPARAEAAVLGSIDAAELSAETIGLRVQGSEKLLLQQQQQQPSARLDAMPAADAGAADVPDRPLEAVALDHHVEPVRARINSSAVADDSQQQQQQHNPQARVALATSHLANMSLQVVACNSWHHGSRGRSRAASQ